MIYAYDLLRSLGLYGIYLGAWESTKLERGKRNAAERQVSIVVGRVLGIKLILSDYRVSGDVSSGRRLRQR